MGTPLINEDEKDDFLKGVTVLGYNARDFVVAGGTKADVPTGNGQRMLRQEVFAYRNSNGVHRTYDAGHGRAWSAEALADIRKGFFGIQ